MVHPDTSRREAAAYTFDRSFAQDLNSPTPVAALVRETIKAAVNQGWGEENASALIKALELEAGVTVEPGAKAS